MTSLRTAMKRRRRARRCPGAMASWRRRCGACARARATVTPSASAWRHAWPHWRPPSLTTASAMLRPPRQQPLRHGPLHPVTYQFFVSSQLHTECYRAGTRMQVRTKRLVSPVSASATLPPLRPQPPRRGPGGTCRDLGVRAGLQTDSMHLLGGMRSRHYRNKCRY